MTSPEMIQRFAMSRLTDEEIELCATFTCADHTEPPDGPPDRIRWMNEMAKTHKQLICGGCLLWKIWVPK